MSKTEKIRNRILTGLVEYADQVGFLEVKRDTYEIAPKDGFAQWAEGPWETWTIRVHKPVSAA